MGFSIAWTEMTNAIVRQTRTEISISFVRIQENVSVLRKCAMENWIVDPILMFLIMEITLKLRSKYLSFGDFETLLKIFLRSQKKCLFINS